MPKHVPTFKHLLHTSHTRPQQDQQAEAPRPRRRQVNREIPAYLIGQNPWVPNSAGGVDAELAELLRRFEHSRWQASRTTAGPAAPPSWHVARQEASRISSAPSVEPEYPPVTRGDLEQSSALLSHRPKPRSTPVPSLLEYCFNAMLRYIDDVTVIYAPDEGLEGEDAEAETYTISRLVREQVTYLEPHLKIALLDASSLVPEPYRPISNDSIRAILSDAPPDSDDEVEPEGEEPGDDDDWDDWELAPVSLPVTSHFALTRHPSPHIFLQTLPFTTSLTSINLAYSTIPNIDALVEVLPAGLKELSLVGVNFGKAGEQTVKRGLLRLGRKLIVLKVLDLSNPRYALSTTILTSLLHPAETQLPSLRTLGMRDLPLPLLTASQSEQGVKEDEGEALTVGRKGVGNVVRGGGRLRWVDIVWD
ncbi:hypothetical protein I350_00989 [Cryptococcus amylolentus CBS 6273]|uniref:Uncharacterized protein n=1 Tax=Cryptococcus amylolentus CBS 6273 TaxID=1296118 RepID=A0A1E3KBA3_9TREE|nr:hypothetical protein I350_00989 [Cryptococcus amylolentus CBS 6273]